MGSRAHQAGLDEAVGAIGAGEVIDRHQFAPIIHGHLGVAHIGVEGIRA
ncbi:MAG: hypothetical protein ACK56F_02125 [bacterium]